MTVAAIDVGQLLELVWASALATIAVAVCFSLVIVGAARAEDNRRAGSASAYAALSVVAGLLFIGIAVFAISVITAT